MRPLSVTLRTWAAAPVGGFCQRKDRPNPVGREVAGLLESLPERFTNVVLDTSCDAGSPHDRDGEGLEPLPSISIPSRRLRRPGRLCIWKGSAAGYDPDLMS